MAIEIRAERPADADAVRLVNELAFGRPDEARLVEALRDVLGRLSLVALADGMLTGHILFTPVHIERQDPSRTFAGLAPMAVLPAHQRKGVGSALVREGLAGCREAGYDAVVVVGHPEYYPRFGFVPAHTRGLRYEHPAPAEAFMVVELVRGALDGASGVMRYRPEFDLALG